MDTRDKGMIHVSGGMELDGLRFHHTIQTGMQFKTFELREGRKCSPEVGELKH